MRNLAILLAAGLAFAAPSVLPALAGDYSVGSIEIDRPWTRATPPRAKVGGGFLVVTNKGQDGDRLTGGTSPVADRVEIHTMEMTDGVMKMRPLTDGLEIAAGETVELKPGGYHVMFIGLKQPFAEGEGVPVTLEFEKAGSVELEMTAAPLGATGMSDDHQTGHDHNGHDHDSHSHDGHDHDGHDHDGHNHDGHQKDGHQKDGMSHSH